MRKWKHAFLLLTIALKWNWQIASDRFPKIFIKKQTRWSNDKTIIDSDCQCLADQDILLNLSRPIIVKYPSQCILNDSPWEADQYSAIIRKFKHRRTFESVDRQFLTKPTIDNDNREL